MALLKIQVKAFRQTTYLKKKAAGLLTFLLWILVVSTVIVAPLAARAQNEESEEARQAAEKAKRRHYPGGRDEQELTVQAALPVTSRYPVDPKNLPATTSAPANDDSHD